MQDIEKLHSMAYVLNECSLITTTEDQYRHYVVESLKRINEIIELVKKSKPSLANEIDEHRKKVFSEEHLTSYWQFKLTMLIRCGAVQ
ncbi:hypothetical protein D9M70_534680 [compost metagenome]